MKHLFEAGTGIEPDIFLTIGASPIRHPAYLFIIRYLLSLLFVNLQLYCINLVT